MHIRSIKNNRKFETKNELWALDKYIDLSERSLAYFTDVPHELENEDLLSLAIEYMIIGHTKHDSSLGRTLRSYLNMQVLFALWSWREYDKRDRKRLPQTSLYKNIGSNKHYNRLKIYDTIKDVSCKLPEEIMIDNERSEYIRSIASHPLLSDKQRDYIEMYYIRNMGMQDIADKLEISRQAVHQGIKNGVLKLKEHFNNVE